MPIFPPDPKDLGGCQGIKGVSPKSKNAKKKFENFLSKITVVLPIVVLLFMIYLVVYTLFLNKGGDLRHIIYYTMIYATLTVSFLKVRESSILTKERVIYFFGAIISFSHLIIVYSIWLVPGAKSYFERNASDKLSALVGFGFVLCILLIKLTTVRYERKKK